MDQPQSSLTYPKPPLADDLVRLRRWAMGDLACIEAASHDPEIPKGTTVPAVYSDAEGRAFIERQWARNTDGRAMSLAITRRRDDEAVGLVFFALTRIRGECRLGYWLVPDARRQGHGSAAVRLVSRWLLTRTHVHRVVARVMPDNEASIALLRSSGFGQEGLLRKWLERDGGFVDALQFSLVEDDLDGRPGVR